MFDPTMDLPTEPSLMGNVVDEANRIVSEAIANDYDLLVEVIERGNGRR